MKNKIYYVLKKELRETFRDKKSLAMMLIIPFILPLIIIGMALIFNSEVNKNVSEYNKIGFTQNLSDIENNIIKSLNINYLIDNKDNLENNLNKGNINAYVEIINNNYIIHYKENDLNSSMALNLIESYLQSYKSYLQQNILLNHNIDQNEFNNIITYEYEVTEEQHFYTNYIVNYAFMFIIMAITVSASYPATDTTAGEKERGTLETLLTFPIKSKDIILGKLLSVTISSIITGFISLFLIILSLIYCQYQYPLFFNESFLNFKIIIISLFIIIVYSILISGLSIAIASMSKSFKEAQSALTPLTLLSFFPSMIAFMLNVKNSLLLSFIPFLNISLILEDTFNNNLNYLYLITMFLANIIFIFIIIYIIIKQFKKEKVLFSN